MILNFKGLALGLTVAAGIAMPAMAQNVGNNAGIWWTPAPGQPSAFTFLNPLTTVYGRIGFLASLRTNPPITTNNPGGNPFFDLALSNGWGGELGIGARLMPVIRYELQLSGLFNQRGRHFRFAPGLRTFAVSVRSAQLLNNFYFDVAPLLGNQLWGLNPYVMAGLGVAMNTSGDTGQTNLVPFTVPGTGQSHARFAWTAGAGIQWQATRNIILDIAYRYLDAGRVQWGNSGLPGNTINFGASLRLHQIMVSIVVPVDGLIRGFGN